MRNFALLVGVSHFEHELGNLEYIENDINEMFHVLQQYLGVLEKDIIKLIDSDATAQLIDDAAVEIAQNASFGDRVILYFATHGKTVYETPYLAAYDAENKDPYNTRGWINTGELLGKFHRAQCSVLGFLDSCQSAMFLTRGIDKGVDPITYVPGQYSIVLAAAGVGEQAHSDWEYAHGCWTYFLLNALKGQAPQAFCKGTRRITASSLQEYLFDFVRYRVEKLYNKKQTPYIWGTRAGDVLISEYYTQEAAKMRIGDIYFGEIDADSEKTSSPQPEYLKNNFYDLNSICEKFGKTNTIQFIAGNKGTGKTFIGEYLCEHYPNIIYRSIGAISISDIKNVTYAQSNVKGKYSEAWKYAIYTILSCIIVNDKRNGYEEFRTVLEQIFGEDYSLLLIDPIKRRSIMFRRQIKNSVRMEGAYGKYNAANGIAPISKLVMLYEDLFQKYYSNNDLTYFLLDGLDEQIRGLLQEDQKAFLLDLLDATQSSNEMLKGVRLVLMFRTDILQMFNGEANINKMITARCCTLSWLPIDGSKVAAPLYQLLEKRISTSARAHCKGSLKLSDIIPPKIQNQDSWTWIMELTTYTPRDLIAFFNECKNVSKNQTCIAEDNIWDATRPYADYLWREMEDIMGGTCLSELGEDLVSIFTKIAHKDSIGAAFSYHDFLAAYESNENLKAVPISDAMKVLYEAGVMGVHVSKGMTYWYFRENPVAYDRDLWQKSTFSIHKGLWKKMHIW